MRQKNQKNDEKVSQDSMKETQNSGYNTKQAALIPAQGIGDALLMLTAAPLLLEQGYLVTVYHDAVASLASWFPRVTFAPKGALSPPYDLIVAQNDNSPFIKRLIQEHRSYLSIFYPTYKKDKHAPLHPLDQVFIPSCSMVQNIAQATASLFNTTSLSFSNEITPPSTLHFRSCLKRVIIHPTSREKEKNWKPASFVALAKKLRYQGFFPLFIVSCPEREAWQWIGQEGLMLVAPKTLSDCAQLIYESGYLIGNDSFAGHLASNLGLPTLIIANDPKRLQLWRPGWKEGQLVFPPPFLPRCIRLRHFHSLISVQRVLRKFNEQNL